MSSANANAAAAIRVKVLWSAGIREVLRASRFDAVRPRVYRPVTADVGLILRTAHPPVGQTGDTPQPAPQEGRDKEYVIWPSYIRRTADVAIPRSCLLSFRTGDAIIPRLVPGKGESR